MPAEKRKVEIRSVWAENLESEFQHIRRAIDQCPFVSMDTEFPGFIYRSTTHWLDLSSHDSYGLLKLNVDELKLIQVGFTLSDEHGNLPSLGSASTSYIWEFNFRDFDPQTDRHAPESIELLRTSGIDFATNRARGIDSARFAEQMIASGLLFKDHITWVTFHGAYDFGYLLKALTASPLPLGLADFMRLLRTFFGRNVFDIKHMIKYYNGLHGGLERVARRLRVKRVVGQRHQAGSDSLLTCQTFFKMHQQFHASYAHLAGVLYGLECEEGVGASSYAHLSNGRHCRLDEVSHDFDEDDSNDRFESAMDDYMEALNAADDRFESAMDEYMEALNAAQEASNDRFESAMDDYMEALNAAQEASNDRFESAMDDYMEALNAAQEASNDRFERAMADFDYEYCFYEDVPNNSFEDECYSPPLCSRDVDFWDSENEF